MTLCRVIVAGGREFNDYAKLCSELDEYLHPFPHEEVTIISGTARGADRLGERYAADRELKLVRMPADWDKHGKSAGYRRNEEMAKAATHAVCFWDGKSRGTQHMINIARQGNLATHVVLY